MHTNDASVPSTETVYYVTNEFIKLQQRQNLSHSKYAYVALERTCCRRGC